MSPPSSSSGGVKQKKNKGESQSNGYHRQEDEERNGEHGDSDERTPLLAHTLSRGDDDHDDDASSSHPSSNDSYISNLGDFQLQPSLLSRVVADKDVRGLFEEIKGGGRTETQGEGHASTGGEERSMEPLFEALQTDCKAGLQQDQYSEEGREERERVYGKNELPERQLKSFWRFLWEAFNDKVLIILTIAAAISFALGMYQDFGPQHDPDEPRVQWVEGVAILTAIVIVTVTSSVNDYSKERQFKALSDSKEVPEVKVLRDGKKYKIIKSNQVLVGDIMHLEAGDILTCDGIVIDMAHDIKVDESDATGESDAVAKASLAEALEEGEDSGEDEDGQGSSDNDSEDPKKKKKKTTKKRSDPFLLSGSKVLEGKGHYVVVAVGTNSFQGKIFMSLRASQPNQTKMQKSLNNLAEKIAKIASFFGALLFVCLFIRNCIELKTKPDRTPAQKGQGFIQSFVIAVTLIVVAVPEGLPLAVTLALAFATNRMTQNNLLVRVFEACETMSNANVVVTDKTGTLTANEMRVVEGTLGGVSFSLRSKDGQDEDHNDAEGEDGHQDGGDEDGARSDEDTADDGDQMDKQGLVDLLKKNEKFKELLAESIAINSTAFEEHKEKDDKGNSSTSAPRENGQERSKGRKKDNLDRKKRGGGSNGPDGDHDGDEEGPKFVGNKTESALLRFLEIDMAEVKRQSYSEYRDENETVLLIPFSSTRKAMGTVVKLKEGSADSKYRLYVKGAAEVVSGLCTKRAKLGTDSNSNGEGADELQVEDINEKDVQQIVEKYAKRSLRTIALAYRDYEKWPPEGVGKSAEKGGEDDDDDDDQEPGQPKYEDLAKDMTLLAIPGIEDPLREGVVRAVKDCHTAGVSVKMCTGDNILTAKAIAKQCGLYTDGEVISGSDWRKLSEEDKREKAPKIQVMARSLPQDKESLVKALQDDGEIVGVTGDGTNDALALKVGDVGFSMGQAGTEVAKEASDVIIMDDNFASLVGAITWGRCVSDAVRKFLQFQLAVNVTAIIITFVSSVTGGDENSVMNAVQLLWVNLIMDTFAALALATDPADRSLLNRKPEPRDAPIISVAMTKMIAIQALYQTTVTLVLHFGGPKLLRPVTGGRTADDTAFGTLVFNVFVWCQIFNMINCRQLENHFNIFYNMHRNIWLLGILLIMIGGQVLIVFFGGVAFDTKPIPIAYWAISVALGAGSLVIGFLARLLPDAPLGQLLIMLKVMPDLESLPRTHSKEEYEDDCKDEEVDDGVFKSCHFIRRIREGRHKANSNMYQILQVKDTKSVMKGLLGAQAMAGQKPKTGRTSK